MWVSPFFNQALDFLAQAVLLVIKTLWGLLSQTAFTTPDVTSLPQVTAITSTSLMIVNVGFVLAILTAGIVVMTRDTLQSRYGVGEVLPRLVVGWIAANFAIPICRTLIRIANALTQALTGDGIASTDAFTHLQRVTVDALTSPPSALLAVIIGVFIAALTATLIVTWLVRLGVLIVLAGIAPVALACHCLVYLDGAARLWWRAMVGTLGTVLLQALALHTTLAVFLNPDANVAALGLPDDPTGTFNLLIVACLLWVVIKIPGLMRRYVTRGGGGQHNIAGVLLRMVVVQRVTGLLRLPMHARGGGRAPGAARAAGGVRGGGPRGSGGAGAQSAAGGPVGYWRPRMPRPVPRVTGTALTPTPARGAGGPGHHGGSRPSSTLRAAPAGVTPATAIPKRTAGWTTSAATPSGTGWPDAAAAGPRTPAGAQPSGTGWGGRPATPARRPRYPAAPARPSGSGRPAG